MKKKYAYKLVTNLLSFILSFFTAGLVPRALGVKDYGNFNFATTIVNQIIILLDFRTSTCFYTKLSQRQEDNKLLIFYGLYAIIIILLLSISIGIINLSPLRNILFPGLTVSIISLSIIYVVVNWLLDVMIKIMDANGFTIVLERVRLVNKVISTVILIILYVSSTLDLSSYFFYLYLSSLIVIGSIIYYLKRKTNYNFREIRVVNKKEIKKYAKEFFSYSGPLGFYVALSFIATSVDRWLLQYYGGSEQQGLYSFSFNLTNFCYLFITALVPLFIRELSIAAKEDDIGKMAQLFRRYTPLLYGITAFFCSFIFIEIDDLIMIFGGKEYLDSKFVLAILAFYPLLSTYSNLSGSVIYATGKTKIFFRLSLILTPIGLLFSFFLLNDKLGYNLGALGLAVKNSILELSSILVILFYNSRFLKISFWYYVFHMIYSVLPLILIGYFARVFVVYLIGMLNLSSTSLVVFLSTGIVYTIFAVVLTLLFPNIFGLRKKELRNLLNIKQFNTFNK